MSTRGRRIRRGLGLALAGLVLVVLVGSLILRVTGQVRLERAIERFEARHGSIDVLAQGHRSNPPKIPSDENAAAWFRAGASAIVWSKSDETLVGASDWISLADLQPDELQQLQQVLDEQAAARSLFHRGAGCTRSNWQIPYKKGVSADIPDLLEIMWGARLLRLEASLALLDGRHEDALDSIRTMMALSRSTRDEDSLIVGLIGVAIQRTSWELAAELVSDASTDLETLESARDLAQGQDARARMHAQIRYDAGAMVGLKVPDEPGFSFFDDLLGPIVLAHWHAGYLDAVSEILARTEQPAGTWEPPAREVEQGGGMGLPHPSELAKTYIFAMPRAQLIDAQELLVMTALELRLTAAGGQAYPDAVDPHPDPLTGKALVYERLDGEGARLSLAPGAREAIRGKLIPIVAENALLAIELPKP